MKHTPSLFIDIGAKSHFYTLRQTYLHAIPGPGAAGNACVNGVYQGTFEERSFHHFNLSQNAAEAIEKATEASLQLGVRFTAPTVADLQGQLDAVHRATADELAARELHYAAMRAEFQAQREEEKAEKFAGLLDGKFTFGQHTGKAFSAVPRGYLAWVVSKRDDFEPESLMRALADAIVSKFSHLLPPVMDLTAHVGEIGQRLVLDVEVVKLASFDRPKFGADWLNETVWITTLMTADRACCVVMSPNFSANEGEKAQIKATIKAHDFYGHQAQTKLQRVVVVGEYGAAPVKKAAASVDDSSQSLAF